ncbi:MAG: pitrilysin family protein [Acidobacteriota bacterium]
MRWLGSFLVLTLALVTLVACGETGTTGGEDQATTDSVLFPVANDPTVSFSLWFDVGSHNDPAGKEGLAAITGSMLGDAATENNSYDAVLEALYPMAASYGTSVDKEMTTLTGRSHVDTLDDYFGLYSDAYLKPAFSEDDFTRIRTNLVNYLENTLRYGSDEELGKAALTHFLFEGTGYAHPVAGTVQGLKSITLDDVRDFYNTWYTADNAVTALGGGYEADLVERFETTADQLPSGTAPASSSPQPAAFEGRHLLLVQRDDADASISFGFPIDVSRGDDDFYALWIANSWLGEHRNSSSHLYQVIREARGMNYGDYSYIEAFPQGGSRQMPPTNVGRSQQIFEIWIRTLPNENALFAIRAALREFEELIENGMSEEEFELTRSFLQKYHLQFAKTTQTRLGYRVDDRFYGIDGDGHLARFGERLAAITREDVNAAIKKHLQSDDIKIAILTGAAEQLRDTIASGAATPITYPNPKDQAILDEDKIIEAYPLNIPAENITIVPVTEMFEVGSREGAEAGGEAEEPAEEALDDAA